MNRTVGQIADVGLLTTLSEILQCDTEFPAVPALAHEIEMISQGITVIDALCEIQQQIEEGLKDQRVLQQAVDRYVEFHEWGPATDDEIVATYWILPRLGARVSAKLRMMRSAMQLCVDGYGDVVPEENRCEMGRLFEHLCESHSEGGMIRDTLECYTGEIYAEMRNEMACEDRYFGRFRRRDIPIAYGTPE